MRRPLLIALLLGGACGAGARARAQFADPRTYDNAPVGVNELETTYGYTRSDASVDESLVIVGAALQVHQETLMFTRYLGVAGRMGWLRAYLPMAHVNGEISGTPIRGSLTGTGDTEYQAAVLLKGGPAISAEEFEKFTPVSTWGVSFAVTAPTGQYEPARNLNLGSNRWAFKPEVAYSLPFGKNQRWELNTYGNVFFFTDNVASKGSQVKQRPLGDMENHVSFSFTSNIWLALDTRYTFAGETEVDGVRQDDSQQNLVVGSELSVNLNAKNVVIVAAGWAPVHVNGPSTTTVTVKYDYSWGGGLK